MTEEKTAKVKPFLFKFRVYVSPIPFSSLEKSAHMTEGFKICSPNFTLFKNGLKSLYSPTVTKTKQNKKAFVSHRGNTN